MTCADGRGWGAVDRGSGVALTSLLYVRPQRSGHAPPPAATGPAPHPVSTPTRLSPPHMPPRGCTPHLCTGSILVATPALGLLQGQGEGGGEGVVAPNPPDPPVSSRAQHSLTHRPP